MSNPCRLPLKPPWLARLLDRLLGLHTLAEHYDKCPRGLSAPAFLDHALTALGVQVILENAIRLDEAPRRGAMLIVANHPLGGLEGIAIAALVARVRPDLKVLTNRFLCRIPEVASLFIGVDVLSGNVSANVGALRQLHRHLADGGAVLMFPSGMVSAWEFRHRRVLDRPWTRLAGQLAKRYQCATLPVYVEGRNSRWFYLAGLIHPRLRTLLLARQLVNKQGHTLRLRAGQTIPGNELKLLSSPGAITDYLRVSTDALARVAEQLRTTSLRDSTRLDASTGTSESGLTLQGMERWRLLEHETFDVYCAPFDSLGPVMEQIAIAREVSFRAAGAGTGLSRDSDRFDPHYLHLFLWDREAQRVAGAYRVGLVDEIVDAHGVEGLYSRSLYKYDKAFIERLGAAIEMGRSFIHPDYQRLPVSLNLLWRGIGRILLRRPRYHTLFGSVSISREYSDLARSLIADTLLTNFGASEFTGLVRPLSPHRVANRVWSREMLSELANVKMLGKLIGRCDPGKTVPVLLRHYLALNGRMVCFNIHSKFNDSLEGLIIVDVRKTNHKTRNRFLGAAGAEKFMNCHKLQESA